MNIRLLRHLPEAKVKALLADQVECDTRSALLGNARQIPAAGISRPEQNAGRRGV
jgi:hypothetical protein